MGYLRAMSAYDVRYDIPKETAAWQMAIPAQVSARAIAARASTSEPSSQTRLRLATTRSQSFSAKRSLKGEARLEV
jgi:hypothetical protein